MSLDPVAVYAAVVATAGVGWQVYQWRSERKGRLDISLSTEWRADDMAILCATFVNSNDYPVRLDIFKIGTVRCDASHRLRRSNYIIMTPDTAGLPAEVPAHDNVRICWDAAEIAALLHYMPFRPGYAVTVTVRNTLRQQYGATTEIRDARPNYRQPADSSPPP